MQWSVGVILTLMREDSVLIPGDRGSLNLRMQCAKAEVDSPGVAPNAPRTEILEDGRACAARLFCRSIGSC